MPKKQNLLDSNTWCAGTLKTVNTLKGKNHGY
jgi:hypothetical protein